MHYLRSPNLAIDITSLTLSDLEPPELVNIHSAFYQGQYQDVVDFDTSAFSPENQLPARVLQLRAKIVLGQPEEVLSEIEGGDTPDLVAVKALAQHAAGDTSSALHAAQELAEKCSENATVQVLCGTVLHAEGQSEEALVLLMKHQGNLEAYVCSAHSILTRIFVNFPSSSP